MRWVSAPGAALKHHQMNDFRTDAPEGIPLFREALLLEKRPHPGKHPLVCLLRQAHFGGLLISYDAAAQWLHAWWQRDG
jgi:hypothetical protein